MVQTLWLLHFVLELAFENDELETAGGSHLQFPSLRLMAIDFSAFDELYRRLYGTSAILVPSPEKIDLQAFSISATPDGSEVENRRARRADGSFLDSERRAGDFGRCRHMAWPTRAIRNCEV